MIGQIDREGERNLERGKQPSRAIQTGARSNCGACVAAPLHTKEGDGTAREPIQIKMRERERERERVEEIYINTMPYEK